MPTYGRFNTASNLINKLSELKENYNIIIKIHHGTNYLEEEKTIRDKLLSVFDKIYDSKTKIEDVLMNCDVVLSDNSGAIFDALYNKIPVCIFSNNIEECSYDNLESLQLQFVKKGIIPFTDNIDDIDKIINESMSRKIILKQRKISNKLFPLKNNDYLKSNLDVINKYLNDDVDINKIKLHRIFSKYYFDFEKNSKEKILQDILNEKDREIIILNDKLEQKNCEISDLKKIIESYKSDYFKIKKIKRRSKK